MLAVTNESTIAVFPVFKVIQNNLKKRISIPKCASEKRLQPQ